MKILMVCLGNICRSPLAEGILKDKLTKYNLDWLVDSAGTGAWHVNEKPDSRSIDVAQKHGIDITDQKARKFVKADFENFDQILVMDSSNYQNVMALTTTESDKQKVKLIMNFVDPGMNQNVHDPYWNDDGFEGVFKMLDEACEQLILALK